MTLGASSSTDKSLKSFDELMITPIDFSAYIMNGLRISNFTQETLLGPAFRLLKGTRSNYAELEYDFEECYKALSEKLDWENPKGDDYPFDLTKPLPLVKRVGDLQLGIESYQKKINVTIPNNVRPNLWKRHPYSPYQDPQGFIYVDSLERNRLMRSDELYKEDRFLGKEKSSLHDQRNQQAVEGKKYDAELGKICQW
nr:hypothetical protein [Tanacetum cinerariifolium]